jgi:hypothetical protein
MKTNLLSYLKSMHLSHFKNDLENFGVFRKNDLLNLIPDDNLIEKFTIRLTQQERQTLEFMMLMGIQAEI